MARKLSIRLPNKPSAFITAALRDLYKAEKADGVTINMSVYHHANGVCEVCLAGSVMRRKVDDKTNASPWHFDELTHRKLEAISAFMFGCVADGLREVGLHIPKGWRSVRIIRDYRASPKAFKADMRRLAADLEKAGL